MGLLKEYACTLDRTRADQAHLSYGNNPLHDAARDGDLEMLRKILDRVPGTFTDNRFSKWEVACVRACRERRPESMRNDRQCT